MKKIAVVLSFLFILLTIPASAKRQSGQVSLYGKVLDAQDGDPIAWATVALLDEDENVIAGGSSDEEGFFNLIAEEGEYLLRCTFIGYADHQQIIKLSGDVVEVAPIKLALSAQTLESATVTERVKLVEMKIDKVVILP